MPEPSLVGLLVVHGIGEQKPFDTVDKVIRGLRAATPNLGETGRDDRAHTVTIECSDPRSRLRLYEVYWADLLSGEGTRGAFAPEKVQSAAWLPWLNLRSRLYPRPRGFAVLVWTMLAVPLSALVYVGLLGAHFFGVMFADIRSRIRPERHGSLVERARQAAEDGRGGDYSWLDRTLDQVAGDVFTYVDESAPGALAPTVADEVRRRFYRQVTRACDDGCEEVHVLAHSLGTVVALNALTGYRLGRADPSGGDTQVRVGRMWTIGSPLEKFAFLWPTLTSGEPVASFRDEGGRVWRTASTDQRPTWVNFANPLDIVAGRPRSFPDWHVEHRRVWAGGVARSHTVYERNRQVIQSLTEGLLGSATRTPFSFRTVALGVGLAVWESLGVLVAIALVMLVGLGILVGTIALVPWLIGTVVGLVVSDSTEASIKDWGLLIVGLMVGTTMFLVAPMLKAGVEHARWRP